MSGALGVDLSTLRRSKAPCVPIAAADSIRAHMLHLSSRSWMLFVVVWPATRARGQELSAAGHAIEVQVSERRLNGREQARFTPFQHSTDWLFVDSMRPADGGRRLFVRLGGSFGGSATIRTTAGGQLVSVAMRGRPRRSSPLETEKQTAWF